MSIQPDFPFISGDSTGYFKYAVDDATIRGRIIQLLNTNPGERCYLCDFGVGVQRYLFEPLDEVSIENLKDNIRSQMLKYEPTLSINVLEVMVMDFAYGSTVMIRLEVTNIKTSRVAKLIFDYPIGK